MPSSQIKLDELPDFGEPTRFLDGEFEGAFVLRVRTPLPYALPLEEGYAVSFRDVCPHLGGRLGQIHYRAPAPGQRESITCGPCPLHGSSFDLTRAGLVILGPATQNLPQVRLELVRDRIVARGWVENARQSRDPRFERWPLLEWRPTNAPLASSRTDDIWFHDENLGWAVNNNGQIIKTEDRGETWRCQHQVSAYLRCIAFASATHGWVGTLTRGQRLFATRDGGTTWDSLEDRLPAEPAAVCGLSVVDEETIWASGTNFPYEPAALLRSTNGGADWEPIDMGAHATLLVDCHFESAQRGWVVGGKGPLRNPPKRDKVKAVVLYTEDGGKSWENMAEGVKGLEQGEWGWKIHFVDDEVGYVSLESFTAGAVLKTEDGGRSWTRLPIADESGQINANLEGVGFVDREHGWVGGWGDKEFYGGWTSVTRDGGKTWRRVPEMQWYLNRFRFFGDPVTAGYAAGRTVYRLSRDPIVSPPPAASSPCLLATTEPGEFRGVVEIDIEVPEGAGHARLDIWDRFGRLVRRLLDEDGPAPGPRQLRWDCTDDSGEPVEPGAIIYRLTVDDRAESRMIWLRA